uniref:Vps39_2 domain-containing protein n=2 Tax=Macrostomum lignano TaxID=282301 RepID=A0A1I8H0R0_9PLAT
SGQRNGVSTLSGNVMRSLTCLLGLDFNSQLEQLIHRNKKHRLNSARDSARPAIAAPPPVPPARRHAEDAVTVSSLISAKQPVVCARCDLPISSASSAVRCRSNQLATDTAGASLGDDLSNSTTATTTNQVVAQASQQQDELLFCSSHCMSLHSRSLADEAQLPGSGTKRSDDWLGIAGELRPQLYVGDDDQPTSVPVLLQPSAPGNRARQHLLDRPPSQALGATIIGIRAAAAAGL